MGIYDNILNGTFSSLGVPQQPTMQPGMMGRGLPTDRLAPGTAGLPNPSPGSGMTAQQLQGLGGYSVDPLTGKLAYSQPATTTAQTNPAAAAAASLGTGVGLPRPRPNNAPTSIDMAAINGQPGVNAVSGSMQPQNGLLALLTGGAGGGLMEQIMGPSKNGLGGLAGLLGGPEQGGLLQQLFGGGNKGTWSSRAPNMPIAVLPGDSAAAASAKSSGQGGYTIGGAMMPTTATNGASRRTYGDTGGGALTGSSAHGHAQWEASKIRDRLNNA